MRIFVTGATGFIGRHLVQRLVARGDHVVALVRSPAKAAQHLPPGVEMLQGDLSLFANPATRLPECDVVVHLAGVVAADTLAQYDAINFRAVEDLIACLQRQSFRPARMLFASSLAAAGPSRDEPWTEDDATHPIDAYGIAKARAEGVVRSAPFPTTAFRPPIVFGPGDDATLTLFKSARTGVGMRIAGKPQALSFVDVRDLVDAIVLMIDDRRAGSFVYYASHAEAMDTRVLWRALSVAVGKPVLVLPLPRVVLFLAMLVATALAKVFRFKNQLDRKQYEQMTAPAFVCSSARLRTELGWAPQHALTAALTHAARGYRDAGLLR